MRAAITRAAAVFAIVFPTTTLRAQAEKPAAPVTDAQVALAAGKRSVSVHVRTKLTYACDRFCVQFRVSSGMTTPGLVEERIGTMIDHIQDAVRLTGAPPAVVDDGKPATEAMSGSGGTLATFRWYRVNVTSVEQGRAVQAALAPFTVASNVVTEVASVSATTLQASSSKVEADPDAAVAAARTKALGEARAQAEQNAKALNMRVGPPLSIGVIDVDHLAGGTTNDVFVATGTVLFELLE